MTEITRVTTYRIGWWTHRWWPRRETVACLLLGRQPTRRTDGRGRRAHRKHFAQRILGDLRRVRRPHRPWQAEVDYPDVVIRFCRRGLTSRAAARRMEHDWRAAQRGERTLYQRWRWCRARGWDRRNLPGESA